MTKTKKDELFEKAQAQFGKKLDRRLSLADLEDQVSRMEQLQKEPVVETPKLVPAKVQNIITGNIFEYNELFAGNPDLQVIEWVSVEETDNGND